MTARTSLIDDYIGRKLRIARIVRNLSQDELAKKVGITFQQIQKYEKGLNRISASRLYWFIKILGVDFDFFFKGIDNLLEQDSDFMEASGMLNEDSNNPLVNIDWESKETLSLLRNYYAIKDESARHKLLSLIKLIDTGSD
jgi:transcriptional regulator with XRE-family HTH domain